MESEKKQEGIKDRLCLDQRCSVRLPLSILYCDAHRPENFQVTDGNGKLIAWKDHPNYKKTTLRVVPA